MIQALPDQIDWLKLTAQIIDGDETAFTYFYDRFFDRLFRYVLVMTRGDEQLSRELLQTTMLKAVRYLKPLSEEALLWSWLTQLAKTSFIDLLRIQKRAPQFLPFELAGQITQPQDDLADDEDTVLEAALEEAVKLLSADEKQLLEWAYFKDWSQKQIAESTQTTPKAVESKLARVRQKLRGMIPKILSHEKQS